MRTIQQRVIINYVIKSVNLYEQQNGAQPVILMPEIERNIKDLQRVFDAEDHSERLNSVDVRLQLRSILVD